MKNVLQGTKKKLREIYDKIMSHEVMTEYQSKNPGCRAADRSDK